MRPTPRHGQRSRRRLTLPVLLVALLTAAGAAQAEDSTARAEALALYRQAEALRQHGRRLEMVKLYEKALPLAVKGFGPRDLNTANMQNNLALLYQELGDYARAEPLYESSLQTKEEKLDSDHEAVLYTLNNLALLYRLEGKYDRAAPLYRRCLQGKEDRYGPDHEQVALTANNLALLYEEMGQYDKAEPLLERSLKIWQDQRGPKHEDVATALLNLTELYKATKRYDRVEPLLRRCLKICEDQNGPNHESVAVAVNNLAAFYHLTGRLNEAEPLYQRARAIWEARYGKDHPTVAQVMSNVAALRSATGDHRRAESLYRDSLAIREARLGADHPEVASSLENLACLYARDRPGEAAQALDRARHILRRHVSQVLGGLSEPEQLQFLDTTDRASLHTALSFGLLRRDDPRAAEASAAWVLNGKAVAQEALAERALLARDGSTAELSDLVTETLAVRKELATLTFQKPAQGQVAAEREKRSRLAEKERELSRQLGRSAGRSVRADPWVGLSEVRKALHDDAVLIEIVHLAVREFRPAVGRPDAVVHYVAWVIPPPGKGSVAVIDLGPAGKIEAAVKRVRRAFAEASERVRQNGEPSAANAIHKPLRDLAELVLWPLVGSIGGYPRWILSPDADLWLVPWAALPLRDDRYSLEQHTIRYVVSGRDLVGAGPKLAPGPPLVMADPDYDLDPARAPKKEKEPPPGPGLRGLTTPGALPRVSRLPGTAAEARAIVPQLARYAGAQPRVYLEEEAQEGRFKAARRPKVVVLSTHGFFLEDRPGLPPEGAAAAPPSNPLLRCGLLLAGCNQRERANEADEDGVLTGLEIVGADLRGTELVVLSACETGLGRVHSGEGVAGLRQAFQLAGARNVVATLWQIPDRESGRLMGDFFANLSAGQGKGDALREAQVRMIQVRQRRNGAAHPFFWAGFTLTGQEN